LTKIVIKCTEKASISQGLARQKPPQAVSRLNQFLELYAVHRPLSLWLFYPCPKAMHGTVSL